MNQITVTCRRCDRDVAEWVALLLQRERAIYDEIELLDSEPIAVLCLYCSDQVETAVQLAVAAAIRPNVKAA